MFQLGDVEADDVDHADRPARAFHVRGDVSPAIRANEKVSGLVAEAIAREPLRGVEVETALRIACGFHTARRAEAAAVLTEANGFVRLVLGANDAAMACAAIDHR